MRASSQLLGCDVVFEYPLGGSCDAWSSLMEAKRRLSLIYGLSICEEPLLLLTGPRFCFNVRVNGLELHFDEGSTPDEVVEWVVETFSLCGTARKRPVVPWGLSRDEGLFSEASVAGTE